MHRRRASRIRRDCHDEDRDIRERVERPCGEGTATDTGCPGKHREAAADDDESHNYETVAVVGKATGTTRVAYRVVGTVRLSTFERELQAVAVEGFRLVAFAIGPKEQVAVLAK